MQKIIDRDKEIWPVNLIKCDICGCIFSDFLEDGRKNLPVHFCPACGEDLNPYISSNEKEE